MKIEKPHLEKLKIQIRENLLIKFSLFTAPIGFEPILVLC